MKRSLFLCLLVLSAGLLFAQTPCVNPFLSKMNNGGGNCPDLNGQKATGTITLAFTGTVDPSNIPVLVSILDITQTAANQLVTDITFGPGVLLTTGEVEYCYYSGPNNNNNLQGSNTDYVFTVSYTGDLPCIEEAPLPVSMLTFTAVRNKDNVILKWATASEQNNLGFEVQRLVGNTVWKTLFFLNTQAVNGNSSSVLNYEHIDNNPVRVITQYRLRQVDIGGKTKLSEIRMVRGSGQKSNTVLYPNPSNGNVSILFKNVTSSHDIALIDMSGKVLRQWKSVINGIQMTNLRLGAYIVRILNTETNEQIIEKLAVSK